MVEHRQADGGLSVVIGGVRRPLTGRDEWVVGRSREADLQVPGEQVGRRHVALRRRGDEWVVEDLASLNGLWFEGQRVQQVRIPEGDVTIHLGGPQGVPLAISFVRPPQATPPTVAQGQPQTYGQPTPSYGQPAPSYGHTPPPQTPPYQQPQPAAQQAPPYQQPQPAAQQAPPPPQNYQQPQQQPPPPPNYQQPQYQQPPQQYQHPVQGYQPPNQGYQQPQQWAGQPNDQLAPPTSLSPTGAPPPGAQQLLQGPTPLVPGGSTRQQQGPQLTGVHQLLQPVIRMGRGQSNDIVLGDLMVSRHHAQLQISNGITYVTDLNSANGTFVNGHRVNTVPLNPGDLVTIGPHLLWFDGTQILEYSEQDGVSFGCADLSVVVDGKKQLLHEISFSLRPKTLLAVVGPSGAGKSTLLHALAGLKPATSGTVVYAGRDLYAEYDDLSQRIGFVPQQDILHQVLTVEQALSYGARLRFPADTTAQERAGRVREVAAELSLTGQLSTKVSRLSGGERKRASTAMELLTKPSLLFLDEPTSGLDTDLDREVMQRLRQLADDGRTVVVVTHNLEYLEICDAVLLLAKGGYPAYLGPPKDAFAHFGVPSWADIFAMLKTRPSQDWAQIFLTRQDRDKRSFPPPLDQVGAVGQELPPIRRQSVFSQFRTLTRRYLSVIGSDKALLAILVLLPAVLAGISQAVPAKHGLSKFPANDDALTLMMVLVVGACLAGSFGAIRELVKERAIYQRERSVGLSAGAYLASKIVVTGTIAAIQGVALAGLSMVGRPGPSQTLVVPNGILEMAVAIALVTTVSAIYGLMLSALVSDENQAIPLLVLVNMANLVMCGALVPLVGRIGLEQLSWLLPARWAFAATSATTDLQGMEIPGLDPDHAWDHTVQTWLQDLGFLAALGVGAIIITAILVRRLDPKR